MIVMLNKDFLDEILALENLCFAEPWSKEAYEAEFIHPYSRTWGWLTEDGDLVGYLTGWLVFEEFHIANLAVHPRRRRKGIAQELLDHAIGWAAANGGRTALLEVRASNEAAMGLYLRNGFKRILIRRNYYTNPLEDALILRRRLNPE